MVGAIFTQMLDVVSKQLQFLKRRLPRLGCIGFLTVALGADAFFYFRDNIHSVVPDQVFRSAQLSASTLHTMIDQRHIRTIVNLRGPNPQNAWYRQEIALAKQCHVRVYDVQLQAYHTPDPALLQWLVEILKDAPRPILIHCKGGSDRTGLASAIILLLNDAPLNQAEQQISFRYFAFSAESVGKLILPYYGAWLEQHHWQSNRERFLFWVNQIHSYVMK